MQVVREELSPICASTRASGTKTPADNHVFQSNVLSRLGYTSCGLGLAWIAAIAVGFHLMMAHETTAGPEASAPALWPSASFVPSTPGHATVLMLAHPKCPCTAASLTQLELALRESTRSASPVKAYVLFTQPPGASDKKSWAETPLVRRASRMPGVEVHMDPAGREANLFGASTSGQVLAYNADRRLIFAGGLTPGRGVSGASSDSSALVKALTETTRAPAETRTPVFGCSLMGVSPSAPNRSPCCTETAK